VPSLVLRICNIRTATPSTRIIRVDLNGASFPYLPGQAAAIGLTDSGVKVPYSIASSPDESERGGYLEFLTKLEPGGVWRGHLRNLKRGSLVTVDGPRGSFTFPPKPAEQAFLFVAGGTGIAPLRSMIWQAARTRQRGRLSLLYSAKTPDDFAYLPDLRRLVRRGRLDLALTATGEVPPRWRGERGRITPQRLAPLIRTPETLCFVCGPVAMVDDVPRMLEELGVAKELIKIEEL
jgi:NAD(P)H-flavin reductase